MEYMPNNIRQWLNNRGINDYLIELKNLSYKNNKIVIPIYDIDGNFLFNKYRYYPQIEGEPKYSYDSGSSSALYNLQIIKEYKNNNHIIICEGELDCLVLEANGFKAVSSTGGAGTFKKEWYEYFNNKNIYICLDRDEAGYKGTFKILSIIPNATVVLLPDEVLEHGDITDFFVKLKRTHDDFYKLLVNSKRFLLPSPLPENSTKEVKKSIIYKNKRYVEDLMTQSQSLISQRKDDCYIQVLIKIFVDEIKRQKRMLLPRNKINNYDDKITQSKQILIDSIIKFGSNNKAKCIWHTEKTASMHYNKDANTVFCFGCGNGGDTLDVVMKLNGCNLVEALKILNL